MYCARASMSWLPTPRTTGCIEPPSFVRRPSRKPFLRFHERVLLPGNARDFRCVRSDVSTVRSLRAKTFTWVLADSTESKRLVAPVAARTDELEHRHAERGLSNT